MKNILVPVDGSGAALRALEQAVALARLSGGTLHLVHAHEDPDIYGRIALHVPREKMQALQREHSEDFLARAEAGLKGGPVPYTKSVLSGPIGPTIAQHAEKSGCDLIIMGSHGKTTIGDLLVGSTAMKVLHASRLPVMLVK